MCVSRTPDNPEAGADATPSGIPLVTRLVASVQLGSRRNARKSLAAMELRRAQVDEAEQAIAEQPLPEGDVRLP